MSLQTRLCRPRAAWTRTVLLAAIAFCFVALPAAAEAQAPGNDDYLDSQFLNDPGTTLQSTYTLTNHRNTFATTEDPMVSDIPEPTQCQIPGLPIVDYGSTVWYDIFPHRPGNLRVVASSSDFTLMVAAFPYTRSNALPDLSKFRCQAAGALGNVIFDYPFRLEEGGAYSIQIGGVDGAQGFFNASIKFDPDTDRDGPVDSVDQCPNVPGSPDTGGCPDGDGDKIRDSDDRCPAQPGPSRFSGCPDSDGDEIADPDDRCPGQRGGADLRGCPDGDGDKVADIDDRCPGQSGPAQYAGCPDTDGDRIPDIDDACDREDARVGQDRNNNGCPDRKLLKPEVVLDPGSYCHGATCLGIAVEKLVVSHIPRRTLVKASCSNHACSTKSGRAGSTKRVRLFHGEKLRAGVKVSVKISRTGYVGRSVVYTILANNLKKGNLRCFVGGRVRACSPALLIR